MPARPGPLFDLRDMPAALGLLTRLPVRVNTAFALSRGAAAAWAWPLAGAVVAGLAGAAGWGAAAAGLAPGLAAGLVLIVQILVTGGLHEDGLADCADGFWGGWTRQRRLEIMKDSRIGSYGVLALILALGLRWQGLMLALDQGWQGWLCLLAAECLSRGAMAGLMALLPRARPGGLSARVGRPSRPTAGLALLPGLACLALAAPPVTALVAAGVTAAGLWMLARLARSCIGGQTGDVLGAAQVLTATLVLTALTGRA